MSEAWARFAADGAPGHAEWEPFSQSKGGMVFGQDTRFVPNLEQDTISLLGDVFFRLG